ncbi:hypothetical protein RND71_026656 [Anisodus tanguticus]|uniref:Uncharacterized protein n=1 Tax=Anisodus tanguticus TaxID=243964 RepID=A0AAE1RNR9_9SOLA|nr:hypothetical protein RND71_026656 [Anisodus tanguticus]
MAVSVDRTRLMLEYVKGLHEEVKMSFSPPAYLLVVMLRLDQKIGPILDVDGELFNKRCNGYDKERSSSDYME